MMKRQSMVLWAVMFLFSIVLWTGSAQAGPGTPPCPQGVSCPEGPGYGTYYANSPAGFRTYGGITYFTGNALRKFVDPLPGLCAPGVPSVANNCIPVAVPDTATYAGSDYYVIGLRDYTQQLHTDLPKATKLRGYYQVNTGTPGTDSNNKYLGPVIVSRKDRPVRLLFQNELGVGAAGNLFIPVDTTDMGAGQCPTDPPGGMYTQNRAAIHLHGGNTPWISDGTPHQWITPIGEASTTCLKGDSQVNVPDMDGGIEPQGKASYFYSNQQSGRLMFYHDHAYGITRLNVYAGEAAGYLIYDNYEVDMINGSNATGINPTLAKVLPDLAAVTGNPYYKFGIPLVIQDKTFVPWDIDIQDALWNRDSLGNPRSWGQPGDLWFPHVYEPNQMPATIGGANPFGRWDYGPWFWPPVIVAPAYSTVPEPSIVPEAFMDTPLVNGKAYPYINVDPMAYRFRILNAANDRAMNFSLYVAEPLHISVTNGGSGYAAAPAVGLVGGGCTGLTAAAAISNGIVTNITITNRGTGYTTVPTVTISGGGGTGATAQAFMELGVVKQIVVTNGGSGYTAVPTVSISPPVAGTPATATASIIQGGVVSEIIVSGLGSCTSNPTITIAAPTPGPGTQATAVASINSEVRMVPALPHTATSVPPICPTSNVMRDAGLVLAMLDPATGMPINGTGLPSNCWPTTWPIDGRDGGVPDPLRAGPAFIQIGNEGGFLPAPVVIPPTAVGYDFNRRNIVVLNVLNKGLFLQPAERADVVVDFSPFAGKTIILYNDAPTPMPGFDPRYDYYTDNPDYSSTGGAPSTRAGEGPNIRTIMQFRVGATAPLPTSFNMTALQTTVPAAFSASQPDPHVPQTAYPAPNTAAVDTYARIQDYALTFTPLGLQALWRVTVTNGGTGYNAPPTVGFVGGGGTGATATATVTNGAVTGVTVTGLGTGYMSPPTSVTFTPTGGGTGAAAVVTFEPSMIPMQSKAIQELFDPWGRMNATLGVELPFTNNNIQTTIPLGYIDPTTEVVPEGQIQFWKITHNGVDTHPVHFHLFNVQVINRVGWDGAIRPPEDNELGWKETVRMNPLEDIVVALQPKTQTGLPFVVPLSSRAPDVTTPPAPTTITVTDPFGSLGGGNPGNAVTIPNTVRDFGWEYVWHCHILGHEENDFMRPFVMLVPIAAPPAVPSTGGLGLPAPFAATPAGNAIQLTWVDDTPLFVDSNTPDRNAKIGYRIERCTDTGGGCTDYSPIAKILASCTMPPPQATLPPAWPCSYDTLNSWVNYNYSDSLVTPGTTYQYRIIAYNQFGDSFATSAFATAVGVTPATAVTLTPSLPSPHFVGTAVTFTAAVTAPGPNPAYQYRFWLQQTAPTLGVASIVQDYSYVPTWALPATTLAGTYTVTVDVRSNLASTTPDPGATASVANYQFVLPPVSGGGVVRNLTLAAVYPTLTAALADPALASGHTLETMGTLFYSEPGNAVNVNLAAHLPTAVTGIYLIGGWDSLYTTNPFITTLQGSLTVTSGTLTVDKLTIQ